MAAGTAGGAEDLFSEDGNAFATLFTIHQGQCEF
jgi:hypothetical protein